MPQLSYLTLHVNYQTLDEVLTFVRNIGWDRTLKRLHVYGPEDDSADPDNIEQWRNAFAHIDHVQIPDFR